MHYSLSERKNSILCTIKSKSINFKMKMTFFYVKILHIVVEQFLCYSWAKLWRNNGDSNQNWTSKLEISTEHFAELPPDTSEQTFCIPGKVDRAFLLPNRLANYIICRIISKQTNALNLSRNLRYRCKGPFTPSVCVSDSDASAISLRNFSVTLSVVFACDCFTISLFTCPK